MWLNSVNKYLIIQGLSLKKIWTCLRHKQRHKNSVCRASIKEILNEEEFFLSFFESEQENHNPKKKLISSFLFTFKFKSIMRILVFGQAHISLCGPTLVSYVMLFHRISLFTANFPHTMYANLPPVVKHVLPPPIPLPVCPQIFQWQNHNVH